MALFAASMFGTAFCTALLTLCFPHRTERVFGREVRVQHVCLAVLALIGIAVALTAPGMKAMMGFNDSMSSYVGALIFSIMTLWLIPMVLAAVAFVLLPAPRLRLPASWGQRPTPQPTKKA